MTQTSCCTSSSELSVWASVVDGNWRRLYLLMWRLLHIQSEWMSRVQRLHQHIIGHFRDESLQSITCTGTDNLTRNKRRNTQIIRNNTTQKGALVNITTYTLKISRLRERTDKGWFSCQEMKQVYSYNPETHTVPDSILVIDQGSHSN